MATKHTLDLTDAEFQSQVLNSTEPVLVDFNQTLCAPCRAIAPILEELGLQFKGKLKIVKINCDENQENAQNYGVRAFPTLLFFKNGEVKDTVVGVQSKDALTKKLEALG